MLGGTKSYIFFNYFKYILINIIIFIGLIWLSQILRILELQHSITTQLIDVIWTTALVLPSFLSPLMPFLLILASFFLNFKFNTSNEIIVLKQYFSLSKNLSVFLIIFSTIFIFYFINNEYLSVSLYQKYKVQELEIRNNLKLGVPSSKEFHIEGEVSIFFEKQKNNRFYEIEGIIYEDGQFIKSEYAEIEINKKNYNLIFYKGERIILNSSEKSKTIFDKFIYSLENEDIETLTLDKEHFNTYNLLKIEDKEFYFQGHNRVYQYFLMLVIILISFKIFFLYLNKKKVFIYYGLIFLIVLILQVINSYLIFLLNKNENFFIHYYYFINFFILLFTTYIVFKFNENN